MDRRGFLGSILAACAAPVIIKASNLMPMARTSSVILPGSTAWLGAIREVRAYNITRDLFMTRWDVVVGAGPDWAQFNVSMESESSARSIYVSTKEAPVAMAWPLPLRSDVEEQRAIAVESLRQRVNESGLAVVRGVLQLPEGLPSARFLA